jgi:hypothetical protein
VTKAGILGIATVCGVIGFLAGVLLVDVVMKPNARFVVASMHETDLRMNISVLKLLDEGQIDRAKFLLETIVKSRLESAPNDLTHLEDAALKRSYARTVELGRRVLSDRSKAYEQLERELPK